MAAEATQVLYPSPRSDHGHREQSPAGGRRRSRALLGCQESTQRSVPAEQLGPASVWWRRDGRAGGARTRLGRGIRGRDDLLVSASRHPHIRARGPRSRKFYRHSGRLDFQILELCRLWGKSPEWFYSLSKEEQVDLLGWHRVYSQPKPPKKASGSSRSILQGVEGSDEAKAWFLSG